MMRGARLVVHATVVAVGVCATAAQSVEAPTPLELRKPIARGLSGADAHTYQLTLRAGDYAPVTVEQRGVDVVVHVLAPDGRPIADVDDQSRSQGFERIAVVASSSGDYRLRVAARYPKIAAGSYEIRVDEVHAANDRDRRLFDARVASAESARLDAAGKYEEART